MPKNYPKTGAKKRPNSATAQTQTRPIDFRSDFEKRFKPVSYTRQQINKYRHELCQKNRAWSEATIARLYAMHCSGSLRRYRE